MIVLKVLPLFILGIVNILVGLAVLLRDYRKLNNIFFACVTFSVGGWVLNIAFFLLANSYETALILAKVYYIFPLAIGASGVLFAQTFPSYRHISKKWLFPVVGGFLLLSVPLIISPTFITQDLTYHDWGKEIILNKTQYLFYASYLLSCFGFALGHIYAKSKREKGLYAAQARLFFIGFLLAACFGVFFNLILPLLGNYRLIHVGPLFTNIFIVAIAYSIIRHRMFDVRLVVARSMAYLLSLGVLIIGYVGLSSVLATWFLGKADAGAVSRLNVILLIFTALTYGPVKRFFDKVTNRVFYRDAYDSQVFLDELNKVLVGTAELEPLLKNSAAIIQKHLKTEFCLFGIKETATTGHRIIGTCHKEFQAEDIRFLRSLAPNTKSKVVVTDYLEADNERLRTVLEDNGIAILSLLITKTGAVVEGQGYLLLGAKKSGNPYAVQDTKLLEIIANELVIAIQNALRFEEIEEFNVTLQRKVTEATGQLRKANEKLKVLNENKDEFIGMASHQLRTPLTSVKGYVSMVLDGDAGKVSGEQRKLLNQAFISSQRMVYLIADLLNVSRLKTGKFVIENKPTNLAEVIEGEIGQLVETAKARDLELVYNKPADFPVLLLDETKIRQVVMNYIDNAVYYTSPGGHIKVAIADKPSSIELTVVDDGIGVPKREQHQLFTKFYRADNAKKARPDGTGLGLYMAKKVIVAQGGAVIFSSEEGKGSTFGFTIPKH